MYKIKKITIYEDELKDSEDITPSAFFQSPPRTHKTIKQNSQIQPSLQSLRQKPNQKHIPQHFNSPRSETPLKSQFIQHNLHEKDESKLAFKLRRSSEAYKRDDLQPDSAKKRSRWFELQDIITSQKVKALKQAFVQKLKRNNPYSTPIQFQTDNYNISNSILDHEGLQIPQIADQIFSGIYIFDIMVSLFMYPLALVFPEVANLSQLAVFQIVSLIVLIGELLINFVQKKMVQGRKLQTLRQILRWYIKNHFILDLVNILAIILAISTGVPIFSFMRLLGLYKVSQLFQKMERLQIYIIENYYNQQYWSLIKILIFNFCFAHFLAILLIIMTQIDQDNNWMVEKHINNAYWGERYIWSYYWGINIMLTVGFGDMVATTYKEALCLIFIETISCLALAYNINCIGNLIANIRAQDIEKSKNFKIFKKMIDKNNLPQQLNEQIHNYIHQSINVKKKFNLQEEKNFVEKLPNSFKTQILRESNKNIFQNMTFFHNLIEKTLFSLAQKIQMVITHPQEIIQPLQDKFNLLILKSGEIGYMCKKPGSCYNNKIIDTIKITPEDNPFLINFNFITKKRQNFEIKSTVYSMIYFLEHQKLIQIFKQSQMDYELYAYLRDKNKYIIDELEVLKCEFCKTKHTKFHCPRIHYIPIKMHVIDKWRHSYEINKNERGKIYRDCKQGINSLGVYKHLEDQHFGITFIQSQDRNYKSSLQNHKYRHMMKYVQIKRRRAKVNQSSLDRSRKRDLLFIQHTTEILKEQLTKLLGAEYFEDETWNLQLDRMKNFKGYFSSDNPSNLREKFDFKKRLKKNGITVTLSLADKIYQSYQLKTGAMIPSYHSYEFADRQTITSNISKENQ